MSSIAQSIEEIVAPQAGPVIAGACVRAAATNAGKTPPDLVWDDWAHVEAAVRGFLGPIAPTTTVEALLGRIKETSNA